MSAGKMPEMAAARVRKRTIGASRRAPFHPQDGPVQFLRSAYFFQLDGLYEIRAPV
jgi:hypothetical protein